MQRAQGGEREKTVHMNAEARLAPEQITRRMQLSFLELGKVLEEPVGGDIRT